MSMRLDSYLVEQGYFRSRARAKEAIEKGYCQVNGVIISKPSFSIVQNTEIILRQEDFDFVSRGGLKLQAALNHFGLNVKDFIALDVGAATGGFSDCLLKAGVRLVFALDIGEGQLDSLLQQDQRVIYLNNCDIRSVEKDFLMTQFSKRFPDEIFDGIDLVVVDISFISVTKILTSLLRLSEFTTHFIFLIKPQFEYGQKHEGIIKDPNILQKILKEVNKKFIGEGFKILDQIPSPILGKAGNQEFLWYVKRA